MHDIARNNILHRFGKRLLCRTGSVAAVAVVAVIGVYVPILEINRIQNISGNRHCLAQGIGE